MNHTKTHNFKTLLLIAEAEKTIRRNSGGSIVYIFSHADFEGVEFYASRGYVHLTKEVVDEDFFVIDEEEE